MGKFLYIFTVLKTRGLRFFWAYFMEAIWFDFVNGTSTSSRVPKGEQDIMASDSEKDNGLLYVASFSSVTKKTLKIAEEIMGSNAFLEAQFLDLGCGKGKTLLIYCQEYGKHKHPAVGIEYDTQTAKIAQKNADKCGLETDRLHIVADTATNFKEHIKSDILVVYLYNSFQGETLRSVLKFLQEIPHVLIYVDPAEKRYLPDYNYQIIMENQGRYNADTWLIAKSGLS